MSCRGRKAGKSAALTETTFHLSADKFVPSRQSIMAGRKKNNWNILRELFEELRHLIYLGSSADRALGRNNPSHSPPLVLVNHRCWFQPLRLCLVLKELRGTDDQQHVRSEDEPPASCTSSSQRFPQESFHSGGFLTVSPDFCLETDDFSEPSVPMEMA